MKTNRHSIYPNQPHAYIILITLTVLFFLPFVWMILASFDSQATLSIAFPTNPGLDNFIKVLSNPQNQSAFGNGLVMSLSAASLVVLVSFLCAYPLSRFKSGFNGPFLYGLLFLTGLPITALMIPTYMIFFSFGWLDSIPMTTLFLTATSLPYNIWMMKSFLDALPDELEEAAAIDGASMPQTLVRVIAPLVLPGIFVIFIFSFLGCWGNFFVPFMLLNSADKLPPAVTIFQFFSSYGRVNYGELASYSILYTTPVLLLYVIAQRFMTKGFALSGAIK